MFRGNLLCFSLCPLPLFLGTGHDRKEPDSVLFAPSIQLFIYINKIPLSLLIAKLNSPSQPFLIAEVLQSLNPLHGPSWYSFQYIHVSLVLRSPELDTAL